MPKIWCYMENCKYLNCNECTASMVEIDEDNTCATFEDYTQDAAYQSEYYIAVKACDGKVARALRKGKKITINEVDFFTDSPPLADDSSTYLTHGRSGFACSTVEFIKNHWEQFTKSQAYTQDVNILPLAEYDEKQRKYVYKKEAAK